MEEEAGDRFDVHDLSNKSDVGNVEGTSWSLSSAKPKHGVAQLMDENLDTLWQSDGTQPHIVNIHFPKRTSVTHVSIYLDCMRDDSYTPTKILVKAGTHLYDLVDVRYREFVEPQGWYHFVLDKEDPLIPEELEAGALAEDAPPLRPIDAFLLQVCVLGNHLNGKDTHVRALRVFGPASGTPQPSSKPAALAAPPRARRRPLVSAPAFAQTLR